MSIILPKVPTVLNLFQMNDIHATKDSLPEQDYLRSPPASSKSRLNADDWLSQKPRNKSGTAGVPMTQKRARDIKNSLNVYGLEKVLLSERATQLHLQGWDYHGVRVYIPEENKGSLPEPTEGTEYTHIPVGNKWGDVVIYSRKR